jgi:hypothetical protein
MNFFLWINETERGPYSLDQVRAADYIRCMETSPQPPPVPAPEIDEGILIRPPGWKPRTSQEAARILETEEEWPEDPDC